MFFEGNAVKIIIQNCRKIDTKNVSRDIAFAVTMCYNYSEWFCADYFARNIPEKFYEVILL